MSLSSSSLAVSLADRSEAVCLKSGLVCRQSALCLSSQSGGVGVVTTTPHQTNQPDHDRTGLKNSGFPGGRSPEKSGALPQIQARGRAHELNDMVTSGSLEQDADVVLLLYRPNFYEDIRKSQRYADHYVECSIAKQRNGPTGPVKLTFIPEQTRSADYGEQFEGAVSA